MKKKHITLTKWAIVIILFVMSMTSAIGLYVHENEKFAGSVAQTGESTKLDSLKIECDSLSRELKKIDSTIKANNVRILAIDKLLKACTPDSLKLVTEKDSLDSLVAKVQIPLATKVKNELKGTEKKLQIAKKQIDNSNDKGNNTPQKNKEASYKPSLLIIIWGVFTILLFSAFIISFILFSGILKLFKSKKMGQNKGNGLNGNNQSQNVIEPVIEDNTSDDTPSIDFELPKPSLTYELKSIDCQRCSVEIKCSRTDAQVYYCVSPNKKDVHTYNAPFDVNCPCVILAMAQCGTERSEQLTIDIDPSKEFANSHKNENAGNVVAGDVVDEPGKDDEPKVVPGDENKTTPNKTRVFTSQKDVIGISYQGDNHVKQTPVVPCQDCHSFTKVNDIWTIAIVSDGAGSKEHSDVGSNAVCAAFTFYLSQMLKTDSSFKDGNIPNEKIWDLEFRSLLTKFQMDLKAKEPFKSYGFESLAATIVILAYSPKGYLFAHVGDGRAGVKVNGTWETILTPHKGEEANQTIFSTTIEFIKKPTLMMSGVFVPETKVSSSPIEAFVLMSDGCEDGAWATYQRVNLPNGDFKVEDVNQPRPQTLDALMEIIDLDSNKQEQKLIEFITTYNKGFKTEGDDKTILIGRVK